MMTKRKTNKKKSGMVDVGSKKVTKRVAIASATITFGAKAFKALMEDKSPKGNVFEAARVAAIMAAKSTPSLIPMCHPLELNKVKIDFKINHKKHAVVVLVEAGYQGRTGVEMEALTGASVAALTMYDMMKWADKGMTISDVMLLKKSGGKSGNFQRGG